MEESIRVMAIGAHLDECHWGCGGTLKLLHDRGCQCVMLHVACSNYTRTPEELKTFDENLTRGAEILGCRHVIAGPRLNRMYAGGREEREVIIGQLTAFQPHIVFIQWSRDSHPDHRRVAQASYDAILDAFWAGQLTTVREIYAYEAGQNQSMMYFIPDVYINVNDSASALEAAMKTHSERLYLDKELAAKFRGLCAGWRYELAEGFKVVRFPEGTGADGSELWLRKLLCDRFRWAGAAPWPAGNAGYMNY